MYPYDFIFGGVIDGTVTLPVVMGQGLGIRSVSRVAGRAVGSYRVVFAESVAPETIVLSFGAELPGAAGPASVSIRRTGLANEADVVEFHSFDQTGTPIDTKIHVTAHRASIHHPP